jgi:CelD/BcsL family acetyltransferase involved in cellulose biosynthesis
MNVREVPLTDPAWREFVSSHPDATPFHLPDWAGVVADCYGFQAFALTVSDGAGEVVAGLPVVAVRNLTGRLRWVSLPFSDSCSPLVRELVPLEDVTEAIAGYARSRGVADLEVRAALPHASGRFPIEVGFGYALELPGDAADLHVSKGHRQNRNHAVRSGITIRHGVAPEDTAAFYRLHVLTRRRQGVPVQPRRFFELIGERMLARGHGFVSTAMFDGEPVAAGLYLTHGRTIVAKFRASDPARQESGAGFLVDWNGIAVACAEGYRTLDFGRTDRGEEGQRRYKAGWGAVESPLVYTHVSAEAPASSRVSVGEVSRAILRHSPPWVTRALGEALYRWTA